MLFNNKLYKAIKGCLLLGIPFAVWRKPSSTDIKFCSNPTISSSKAEPIFNINLWNTEIIVSIHNELNLDQTLSILEEQNTKICRLTAIECEATNKNDYIKNVSNLINTLKLRGGKTVISRTTVGCATDIDWCAVAQRYFKKFDNTFTYLYYTPMTGAWLGASPELLLSYDKCSGQISTMSLAGTRYTTANDIPWDDKNKKEQQIVTDFIVSTLNSVGLDVNIGEVTTLNYGSIEHLCTRISAIIPSGISFLDLTSKLSPTPALAGYPREKALNEISQIERHKRQCYGGYIFIDDKNRAEAYVNIRCVNFDNKQWCIYTGGGITADSDAISEWNETEAKASALLSLIARETRLY
jgi:isochorismate synthase